MQKYLYNKSSDRNNYRLRTRYLILFLDKQNQLLHDVPFQIGINAGVGAAFNTELKEFRKEIETVFFAQINKPQQQLSSRAHSLTVLDLQLGLHKSEGKAPYICPEQRLTPDKSATTTRRDRLVELAHQPIESMIIPKASDTGKLILHYNRIRRITDVSNFRFDSLGYSLTRSATLIFI